MTDETMFNENDVLNALRVVPAPYMTLDMVAADMIKDIRITGKDMRLTLEMKIPSKNLTDRAITDIKQSLADHIPGMGSVEVEPATVISGLQGSERTGLLKGVKNSIAVASGKGGVGKSTVAVNLAVALAKGGARVGLIDADIYGPSIPLMMNIHEQPKAYKDGDKTRLLPTENYGVKLMSIGFLVDPDDALIWRGPMASGALKQFMTDVDWGELDYLLFDMPPGTGDIQLTLSQSLPLTGTLIVTTPQDIALADARKGIRMFEKVSVPILGLVENMSYYICDHCGNRDDIFHHGGGKKTAEELNVPFLGSIPITTIIREGGDKGVPIVELAPENAVSESLTEVAMSLAGRIAENNMSAPAAPEIDISLG